MKDSIKKSPRAGVRKLGDLIRDIRVAMLVTSDGRHGFHGRPMMTQEAEFDGTLWFFTAADSPKDEEIRKNSDVQLSYMDPDSHTYVSVSGSATVVQDIEKARELWRPSLRAWFPHGPDDPGVALLRVEVDHAEYWDAPSRMMVVLISMAKAAIGKSYAGEGSLHQKVKL